MSAVKEVQGSIEFLGLLEFLQIAAFNHRSLVLMLENPVGSGHLVMNDGDVVDAVLESARGVGALFPLLQGSLTGSFHILPPPSEMPQRTINLKTDAILMRVAMSLPPPEESRKCNAEWSIRGTTSLLSAEEMLQIFEASKKPAICDFGRNDEERIHLELAEGGILKAVGQNRQGADAVYPVFQMRDCDFTLTSPAASPTVERMLDIAGVVMEGLRRIDEQKLLGAELTVKDNPHAEEMLGALERGELDESARMTLAKRYLPGGEIAPAFIIARLTVDPCEAVRMTAMETLHDLPDPVIKAFANDPETPPPLLFYLLCGFGNKGVSEVAIANPATPVEALIDFAGQARPQHMAVYRKQTERLKQSSQLRKALRQNEHCDFIELLDELDKEAVPRMRKRSFTGMFPKVEQKTGATLVLQKPEVDPRKEKPQARLGPKDIQYLAKRGTLREKMDLVCGNDDDVAAEIVSQPGVPESFILGVAEATAANSAALRVIAGQRSYRRNASIVKALVYNPKTPVPSAVGLLSLLRPDELMKVSGCRDIPDGTRQGARQILAKRQKKPKK